VKWKGGVWEKGRWEKGEYGEGRRRVHRGEEGMNWEAELELKREKDRRRLKISYREKKRLEGALIEGLIANGSVTPVIRAKRSEGVGEEGRRKVRERRRKVKERERVDGKKGGRRLMK